MNRKVIFILGGLLVLILALGGYILFGRNKTATPNTTDQTQNTTDTSNQTPVTNDKIVKISDTKAVSPALSYTGNAIWYWTQDGHLFTINLLSGLKKEYALPSNLNVSKVIWPVSGDDFIVMTETAAAGRTFNYYDSAKKVFVQYPKNIRGVDFTPDGKQVIYNWVTDKNLSGLTIANPDTSAHQAILDLPDGDYDVKVSPAGDKVFVYQSKTPADHKLGLVDLKTKKLTTIAAGADNSVIWAPDGTKFAFNKPDSGAGDDLWIGDLASTTGDRDTELKSAASRASFDSTGANLYLAANGSVWRISLADLKKTKILDSTDAVKINPSELFISKDGNALFFLNDDGYLYRADLTQ